MNGTVIQNFLAVLKLQKILGNICFFQRIFYRKQSLGAPDYYCEKPICMRCRVRQLQVKVLDFAPSRGGFNAYVRELELSHSKPVNRIIKITHAHNLHVKMLVFDPLQFVRRKTRKLFTTKFSQTILRNHLDFISISVIKLRFKQR